MNGELIMKEKNHFQKQYDFLNKAQKLDEDIKELYGVAQGLNDENNMMWAEIRDLNEVIPKDVMFSSKINLTDRNQFQTTEQKSRKHDLPKNWISIRDYSGPEIQPQKPTAVLKNMGFTSSAEEKNMSNMQLIQKHAIAARNQEKKVKTERDMSAPKRSNLLSTKEKGYLLTPEYRMQVKQGKVPMSVKNKHSSQDYGIPKGLGDNYFHQLDIINEQNTDSESLSKFKRQGLYGSSMPIENESTMFNQKSPRANMQHRPSLKLSPMASNIEETDVQARMNSGLDNSAGLEDEADFNDYDLDKSFKKPILGRPESLAQGN